jgi:hypothetical protein
MTRGGIRVLLVTLLFSLNSCTLEGFDIVPCSLGDALAFRIKPIRGWFSDYQLRPNSILVLTRAGPQSKYPGVWGTDLKYYSNRDNGFDRRPARTVIAYGERIIGWDVDQAPQPLQKGRKYGVSMQDGGHSGWADFVVGESLPAC